MKENFNSTEGYRDNLTKELKDAPKEKREEILETARQSKEYKEADRIHKKEVNDEKKVKEAYDYFQKETSESASFDNDGYKRFL